MGDEKIIEYENYCQKCEHYNEDESNPKSACWVCLDEPVGINSRRPINFKEVRILKDISKSTK